MANKTYNGAEIEQAKSQPESNFPGQQSAYDAGENAFSSMGLKKKEDGDPRHNGSFASSDGSAGY